MSFMCYPVASIALTVTLIMSNLMGRHMLSTAYELTGNKVIVGAGMAGLSLARLITDAGMGADLTVYEKSAVFGGRCATRASRDSPGVKYDTGAQYYSLKPVMNDMHNRWSNAGMVSSWFSDTKGVVRMRSTSGMSSLPKQLTADIPREESLSLNVQREWKVVKLERINTTQNPSEPKWKIHFEKQDPVHAHTVVLTCPLPQSIDILNDSGIEFDSALSDITYAKAICVLFESDTMDSASGVSFKKQLLARHGTTIRRSGGGDAKIGELENGENEHDGFYASAEGSCSGVYTICDQQAKGVSTSPAWTVVMNPDFSEQYFDEKDESIILSKVSGEIQKLLSDEKSPTSGETFCFQPSSKPMIKKWKFSHPNTIYPNPFCEVSPGLFLAGDSFGAPSINGAILSATKLAYHFTGKK